MESLLRKKNLPHVETIGTGYSEELVEYEKINIRDVILGMSELNKNKICLLEISVGTSREGTTKIKNVIENGGLYDNEMWFGEKLPTMVDFLPEGENIIPFKSDSWCLGEFIVRTHTNGKTIPKRFMKSQELMNKFIDTIPEHSEILKKILVLDPYLREFTWNLIKEEQGCILQ